VQEHAQSGTLVSCQQHLVVLSRIKYIVRSSSSTFFQKSMDYILFFIFLFFCICAFFINQLYGRSCCLKYSQPIYHSCDSFVNAKKQPGGHVTGCCWPLALHQLNHKTHRNNPTRHLVSQPRTGQRYIPHITPKLHTTESRRVTNHGQHQIITSCTTTLDYRRHRSHPPDWL
jgi:hypothetical protein